ncbi:uncharacterized protein METZ01_LOCUS442537, partial [marine metagenome]
VLAFVVLGSDLGARLAEEVEKIIG